MRLKQHISLLSLDILVILFTILRISLQTNTKTIKKNIYKCKCLFYLRKVISLARIQQHLRTCFLLLSKRFRRRLLKEALSQINLNDNNINLESFVEVKQTIND